MRRWSLALLCLACSADAGDDTEAGSGASLSSTESTESTGSSDGSSESGSSGTQDSGTDSTESSSSGSSESSSGTDGSSSETGPDCDAPADCETCWLCARDGACKAPWDTCQADVGCIPSLYCIETMCTEDGLLQECADLCCMSCQNTGACSYVDAAITCIEQQCAQLCGDISCP